MNNLTKKIASFLKSLLDKTKPLFVPSPKSIPRLLSLGIAFIVVLIGYTFITSHAAGPYEGKMLIVPSGDVFWIKDDTRHYVGNDLLLNCIRVRGDAGDPIPVDQSAVDSIGISYSGYCPYPSDVHFVRGDGQAPV